MPTSPPPNTITLVVGTWTEVTDPDIPELGVFYFDSVHRAIGAIDLAAPTGTPDIGFEISPKSLISVPIPTGKKLYVKLLNGAATITWPKTAGYGVWQWSVATQSWTLLQDRCGSLFSPVAPATHGTLDGEVREVACVL